MQMESIESSMLSTVVNPTLRRIISRIDVECEKDGNLMVNSLRRYLGDDVGLCRRCSNLSKRMAGPFYEVGARVMRVDKRFMKSCFVDSKYGEAWLKGFALMMKGIGKYGARIPFTPGGPFEVVWNFTYKCNLKCKHCYENAGAYRPELSTEERFRVVDKLSKVAGVGLPALSFSGGEPLVRKDFFEVAAYTSGKIPHVSVATNGTLLTKDNVRQMKNVGIDFVEASLDGATKIVHERFRGVRGCFEKTMKGIQNCLDEGLDTCIASTIQKENLDEVEKIIETADRLGVRFMHFNYVPTGRAKAHIELDLTPEERLSILETIGSRIVNLSIESKKEKERTGKSDIVVDRLFSTCPQYASVVKRIARQKNHDFAVSAHYAAMKGVENVASFLGGCGAGRLYVCLEPNGDIKPCVFLETSPKTVRGNILRENFEDVWDREEMFWQLRTRENLKSYEVGGRFIGCGSCEDKYICGGCRARSFSYFDGDLEGPDVGCIANKELWERTMSGLANALTEPLGH